MKCFSFIFSVTVALYLCTFAQCDRTSQKIYVDVNAYGACFRRLNGTHQVGCSSERKGNVGVLHYIQNSTDQDWLINTGPHKPYVVLLTPEMFTRDNVYKLKDSGKVNGIMVIYTNRTDAPTTFSPDTSCPNDAFSLYGKDSDYGSCKKGPRWNAFGSGLMFDDFHYFPIVVLANSTEVNKLIHQCYNKFNVPISGQPRQHPLCAASVKDAMDGAKDTPTCIKRSNRVTNLNPQTYCDPMGDYSVFSFVRPIDTSTPLANKSVIVISTRMDAFSMFDNIYPSADSAAVGIVTLLAVAEVIGKVNGRIADTARPIMFTFLNGESFDYIGSQRLLYEMHKNQFPSHPEEGTTPHQIHPEHIGTFLEVSQVGLMDASKVWIHTDPISMDNPTIKAQIENLTAILESVGGVDIDHAPDGQPLPPASVQTFLRDTMLPAVVIADHQGNYTNPYYNSRYDFPEFLDMTYPDGENDTYNYVTPLAEHLTKVATTLARTLFTLTGGSGDVNSLEANSTTVTNLLYCFLESPQCELFNYTLDGARAKKLSPVPYPFYVGVRMDGTSAFNSVTRLVQNLLSHYLGDVAVNTTSEEACDALKDPLYTYIWMQGSVIPGSEQKEREGLCVRSTANLTEAKSPAFIEKDYDWDSQKYSAWTESRWAVDAMLVRAFLIPSPQMEIGSLCFGLALFLVFMLCTYCVNKRAAMLFQPSRMPIY